MAGEDLQASMRQQAKERGLSQLDFQRQSEYSAVKPKFWDRLTGSVKGFVEGWLTPGKPLPTVAPEGSPPRQFDYTVYQNVQIAPRAEALHGFDELMALSDYSLVRFAIENRKNQVAKLKWDVRPVDATLEEQGDFDDPERDRIKELLRMPDGEHDFPTFVKAVLEQHMVLDAVTIEPVMNPKGDVLYFSGIHGATIALKVDERGRTPRPPNTAYQQIIKGMPYVDFTTENLIYKPWNVRFNQVYGLSHVEILLMIINIGLRREIKQLAEFTDGTLPTSLMAVPESWAPQQIKEYQDYFDARYGGNLRKRASLTFVPAGTKSMDFKDVVLKNEFDEWLVRLICFVFGLQPTAFIKEVNRATAESSKKAAIEEGLEPLMIFLKTLFDLMIQKFLKRPDLEFAWTDESQVDPKEEMEVRTGYVKTGIVSVDEVRVDMGLEPVGMENAIYTSQGAVLLKDIISGKALEGQGSGGGGVDETVQGILGGEKVGKVVFFKTAKKKLRKYGN